MSKVMSLCPTAGVHECERPAEYARTHVPMPLPAQCPCPMPMTPMPLPTETCQETQEEMETDVVNVCDSDVVIPDLPPLSEGKYRSLTPRSTPTRIASADIPIAPASTATAELASAA